MSILSIASQARLMMSDPRRRRGLITGFGGGGGGGGSGLPSSVTAFVRVQDGMAFDASGALGDVTDLVQGTNPAYFSKTGTPRGHRFFGVNTELFTTSTNMINFSAFGGTGAHVVMLYRLGAVAFTNAMLFNKNASENRFIGASEGTGPGTGAANLVHTVSEVNANGTLLGSSPTRGTFWTNMLYGVSSPEFKTVALKDYDSKTDTVRPFWYFSNYQAKVYLVGWAFFDDWTQLADIITELKVWDGGSAGVFRYWRMNVTQTQSAGNNSSMAAFSFRKSGASITSSGDAPTKAFSECNIAFGNTLNLFDGNASTNCTSHRAASLGAGNATIWDFGANETPDELRVQAIASTATTFSPKDFTIDKSIDGRDWVNVKTVTGQSWTNGEVKDFAIP